MGNCLKYISGTVAVISLICACSVQKKISKLEESEVSASLSLSNEAPELNEAEVRAVTRDTLTVTDDEGKEIFIMKAIRDDESGDMVATEVLDAAVVTARFRNVAERQGKVDLAFQVTVPASMQDSRWQLRFFPDMFVLGDSIRLDPVIITGKAYRKAQLKGYQQYEKFVSRIVSDSTRFINVGQLEIFLKRNIPQLYAFKADTSFVSDEQFLSVYGVTEREAVNHYTNKIAKSINDRRKARMDRKYARFVKAPIVTEGIRLDTVMVSSEGEFIYHYVQTINTRPNLRKADIVLSGAIFEQEKQIYSVPATPPLTFYISTISSFADEKTERYKSQVIERRAEANTACYVEFAVGKSTVDESLGENASEIGRIKGNIADLMQNTRYDLDSIVVVASASPEGSLKSNERLSDARSQAVSRYLDSYIRHLQDSIAYEAGFAVDENGEVVKYEPVQIPFVSRSGGENWQMLDALVERDTVMTDAQKEQYRSLAGHPDLDGREAMLQKEPYYKHLRQDVYPRLRVVKFNFFLHRKGMVKDTVRTTELDTVYARGVQLLKDMKYPEALEILLPYNDYNTAVALTGLNRNLSALMILSEIERTPEVDYLLAVVYSRMGDPEKAVDCYMRACRQNHSFVYRGNLDPEISVLIKTYGLNAEPDDDYYQ